MTCRRCIFIQCDSKLLSHSTTLLLVAIAKCRRGKLYINSLFIMCFTIYKEKKLLHHRSMKTWNMYNARAISLNLYPTTSNSEGVQIDCTLMNKLFIYNNFPLLLFVSIFTNYKIFLWDRTFEALYIYTYYKCHTSRHII